tara:strand:- start:279 stop:464 length:186 start_codon:yes stop_codon:yes gene_type:complete
MRWISLNPSTSTVEIAGRKGSISIAFVIIVIRLVYFERGKVEDRLFAIFARKTLYALTLKA